MADDKLMAEVDQRTRLAFSNEMEMLTFYLTDRQLYGLNVFKTIEILETPKQITKIPYTHPTVKGEINFRGHAITLIDLAEYLGLTPIDYRNEISYVLICEYSTTVQGFLVTQPNILITKSWNEIIRPEGAIYDSSCLVAFTYENGEAIQILDVEKILNEIFGIDTTISQDLIEKGQLLDKSGHHILAVDDSKAACQLMEKVLSRLEIQHTVLNNPKKAMELLEQSIGEDGSSQYTLIFTDIEMPIMDGFTFTRKVKANPRLSSIYLAVHSSLSNQSNKQKASQMGANDFIPKFTPDNIVGLILQQLEKAGPAHP